MSGESRREMDSDVRERLLAVEKIRQRMPGGWLARKEGEHVGPIAVVVVLLC